MVRTFIAAALMMGALLLGFAAAVAEEGTDWTRSGLLAVADGEAARLGYEPDKMTVSFDTRNSRWQNYMRIFRNAGRDPEKELNLGGRLYWAIYYAPIAQEGQKTQPSGGDLWVFVDYKTREVVTVLRGQ